MMIINKKISLYSLYLKTIKRQDIYSSIGYSEYSNTARTRPRGSTPKWCTKQPQYTKNRKRDTIKTSMMTYLRVLMTMHAV
jgi:hypothetical protein